MNKKLRSVLGLLLCAAILMSVLPVSAAGQEGKQLYNWTASAQAQDVQELGCNLLNDAGAQIRWNDSGVIYTQQGNVAVKGHSFLNESGVRGTKAYGLPEGETLTVEVFPTVYASGMGAVAVSFIYAYDFASGMPNPVTDGKMSFAVSENGVDWSSGSVGVRKAELLGGGTLGSKQMLFYRVWSENLMDINSLAAGDLIHGVRIRLGKTDRASKGSFTLCELQLVGFDGKGAFTSAVPVAASAQQGSSKVDIDDIRKQMLDAARNSKSTDELAVITEAYSMVASVAPANFGELLKMSEIQMVGGITTKAAERVLGLFEAMYERDLLTKAQGDSMIAEYETITGTKDILMNLNTPQQVMRGYAAAKPADILLQVIGNSGHAYLVVSSDPAYLADDFTIDPNNSKLTCLTPDGEKTYTYTQMYTKDFFVPVTLDVLADGKLASAQAEVIVGVDSKVHLTVAASLNIQRVELSMNDYTATVEKPGSNTVIYTDSKLDAAVAALADGKHVLSVKVYSGAGDPIVKTVELQVKDGKATVLASAADHSATCRSKAMTDVDKNAWYHEAVDYALAGGIMSGYNATTFGPNDTLSRAMVVQVLYNKEGQPAISGKHDFTDVPADQWFNNAVTWGTQNGVMGGYGDGKFGPNDSVTIEQIAVILWNYSGNPAFSGKADSVGAYSGWAANALAWAVENNILAGVPFTNATENATRAQTAQMLMNYLTKN